MSEEEKDDKQFDATEQKLRKAREKGDLPRSTELNAAMMYAGAWLVLAIAVGYAVRAWLTMASRAMGADGWPIGGVFDMAASLGQFAAAAVLLLLAVPLATLLVGIMAHRALVFSPQKLAPDPSRLNPFKNAKQKFGVNGLVTFAISLGKAALVTIGGWYLFAGLVDRLSAMMMTDEAQWVGVLGQLIGSVLLLALAISVAFGGIDLLWKFHEHRKRNRMTRKEMEDENKDSEGDPHLKAARRRKAIDLAMSKMLADVETADVIIVNPTHYAVALKWRRGSGRAPICVAKGVDEVAARIRERAGARGVPIWSDPPCARAIHASVRIGEEIRADQFAPVAAAIRFAEKMRERARRGW